LALAAIVVDYDVHTHVRPLSCRGALTVSTSGKLIPQSDATLLLKFPVMSRSTVALFMSLSAKEGKTEKEEEEEKVKHPELLFLSLYHLSRALNG